MSSFNLSNFKKIVPVNLYKEGEMTFNQGGVTKTTPNKENEWLAEVTVGREVFNVEIMIDNEKNILDHFCDCPSETEHCRHQVAVFLKLKEIWPTLAKKKEKKAKPEKPVKKKKLSPVETILGEITKVELYEFLRKALTDNKVFKNQFLVHFADKNSNNDRKFFGDVLRSTATSIKRNGYLGTRDSKKFIVTATEIATKASAAFETKKYKDFAPIGLAIIESLTTLLKRMEDSEGKLHAMINTTLKHFGELSKKAPYDLKMSVFKELFEVLEVNISEIHQSFRPELLALWQKIGQEADLHKLYNEFLDKQMTAASRHNSGFWAISSLSGETTLETDMIDLKKEFYKANKLTDKIPELLAKSQHISRYRKEYVEYLFTKKDFTEAKKVLEKYIFNKAVLLSGNKIDIFWLNKLDEANEKLGDKEGTIKALLQRFRFGDYKQFSVIEKIKKMITKQQWNETVELLVKEITEKQKQSSISHYGFYQSSRSTKIPAAVGHFYVLDERWDDLEKMVLKNNDIESYATFCEYLLMSNFKQTFKYLEDNLMEWFKKGNYSDYPFIASIVSALQNAGPEAKDFTDKFIHHLQTYHKGKKTLAEALRKKKVVGF